MQAKPALGVYCSPAQRNWFDTTRSTVVYCSQHRGNLVSVHSPGQQVFVQDLVRRHTDQPVWIGGYDAAQEGMWLWSDGSAVDGFYWEEEEPSNSGQGENCMELHTGGGRGWNDVSCGELRFYVCSMETRSGLAVMPSQKQTHERELVEEVSFMTSCGDSEKVADETSTQSSQRDVLIRKSRVLQTSCCFSREHITYQESSEERLRAKLTTL
ncbi:C-type lectin lectoxin-Thr1-like, partial [Salvelinus sp. IW2-2015]|uniref:C-type lectin lectoxin-Thr1-like n=1 Tax=Salvelinus sp. IW2-2015 TaxID=2691554 RepID=UPI000CEA94C8